MSYAFDESEIPYETLTRFGLTHEMVEDLPEEIIENILNGQRSPVLPVAVTLEEGEVVKARTRIQLVRQPDGNVDVLFYPKLDEYDLQLFDNEQKEKLMAGKAIMGRIDNAKGGTMSFFQIDPENRQVLSVPTPVIGRNIQYVSDRYNLSAAEVEKLQNGEILSIMADEEEFTVGIDLNSKTGIRFAAGNEETWRKESRQEWKRYQFGIFGCWVADKEGNLDYVPEKDYTEDMWEAQRGYARNCVR